MTNENKSTRVPQAKPLSKDELKAVTGGADCTKGMTVSVQKQRPKGQAQHAPKRARP